MRLDLPGALTATAALGALIFGVSQGQQHGVGSHGSWTALVAAAVAMVAFVVIEQRSPHAMLPVSLLRGGGRPAALMAILVRGYRHPHNRRPNQTRAGVGVGSGVPGATDDPFSATTCLGGQLTCQGKKMATQRRVRPARRRARYDRTVAIRPLGSPCTLSRCD